MIKVSVMYPNQDSNRCDIDYYCTKHMPMLRELVGDALRNMAVEEGLAGMTPGSPAPYLAMGHLYFDSVAAFQDAFLPHAALLLADLPNFTNCHPTIQISTVKL